MSEFTVEEVRRLRDASVLAPPDRECRAGAGSETHTAATQ